MPTDRETGFNPDVWLYRIGDRIFQNDCLMRAETKFAPYVDVDEIILSQGNQTLLEFLEAEEKLHKDAGGFAFPHVGIAYEGAKLPHLNATKEGFDWKTVDFEWLKTAHYTQPYSTAKVVSMPDRTDLINIHWISRLQWPYKSIGVSCLLFIFDLMPSFFNLSIEYRF